ncbi:uncharacterized protein LOC117643713 isoform X2 [Thrips palmi]|uniref:Uncharacterized protein LOC117643713 isoform X2 n=1 Tax=Thrips palmi TaxID=161013 RepID=A0A6P8ZLD4_THRPL|nr:uncharacterized protein LOC117643713 isoform X2 [Thrips palmi]
MKHANGREVGERRKQHSGRNNIRAGAWSIMSSLFCLLGEALMLSFVHQAGSNTINSFAGPFIAFGHTFEPCPSDGSAMASIRASHFNPVKPFDRQMLTGYMSANFNISDNLLWKENAFVFSFPNSGCSALRDQLPDMYRIVAKHTGASMDKKAPCVIPGGYFDLKNESVSWTFPNFPVMPYGRYMFRVTARHMKNRAAAVPCFCLAVDCEVIPKPTVGSQKLK